MRASVPRPEPAALVAACLAGAAALGAVVPSGARALQEPVEPFVRFPDVSPDGGTVAFAHQGDIFRVPVEGGLATRLTVHEAYESEPRWSPDGSRIAFQSDRWGGEDVFVMGAEGDGVRRLTWHSADDELGGWTPDGALLFSTRRTWAQVEWEDEIHGVPAGGGTPDRLLDAVGFAPAASPDGRFVVFVAGANRRSKVGYRGPADRDLWLHDTRDGGVRRLTEHDGNDMRPAWAGERTLLFLSDRDGGEAYNLHRLRLDDGGDPAPAGPEPLTSYAEDGVRHFGVGAGGSTVVFERRTSLWVVEDGGEPRRLDVRIPADGHFTATERETFRDRATEYAVSPDGGRVALVIRGELWLVENDADEGRTVRLTDDVHRDRDPAWLSDSTLVFASDRDGDYDLYRLESADDDEPDLFRTLKHRAVRLTESEVPERRPAVSPDGERLAFVPADASYATADGEALVVADVEEGGLANRRVLLDGWAVPEGLAWSPDGRWLAYSRPDLDFNEEVFVVAADGSAGPVNVSQHPKADSDPVWSRDGSKLGFLSTRNNGDADVWFAWLREADWQRTEEDWELVEELEEDGEDDQEDGGEGEDAGADTVRIDLDRVHERLEQVTGLPGHESDVAVSPDGETFWFVTNRDGWREYGGDQDIWRAAWDGTEVERLTSGGEEPEDLRLGPGGEHLFFLRDEGRLARAEAEDGEEEDLSFAARTQIDHRAERAQVFDEAWRLLDRNFYDPAFHGEDWDALRDRYRPRALAAPTKRDFRDVFNLMLGELNSSHQGMYGPDRSETHDEETGLPGVEIDPVEDGVRIERVVPNSPADREASRLREGEVITAVEGTPVPEAPSFWALLADRADRRTLLAVRTPDGEEREVVIRPADDLEDELYDEWVERRRELTEDYSDGRLGYVHVEGMNWPSFERFERELQAAADGREGLLVDVRFNGGGWTTDYLLTVLTYPQHAYTVPRGATPEPAAEHRRFRDRYPFGERLPQAGWTKPVAALANQNSYSNAEIFSHAFSTLGLGPLVGEPTFGAVISTGGAGLMDGSYVRIPFRGWYVKATDENMEHGPATPDHHVPGRPDDRADGEDEQLMEAVEVLLGRIDGD